MLAIARAIAARLRAAVFAAIATFLVLGPAVAQAQDFRTVIPQGQATVKLNQIKPIADMLAKVGLQNSLGNIDLASVNATSNTISGFVNFIAMRWNFLFFAAGTESYFALEPVNAQGQPRTPKLSDFLNVPGIQLTDMLTYDRVAMAVAVRTVTLNESALPAPAKAMFGPYFQNRLANVELNQGVTFFGMADLGKLDALRQAITAIGGQSTQLLFKAALSTGVLDSLSKGQKPSISARFEALLPSFRPRIGTPARYIEIPAEFTFGLVAQLSPPDVSFGYFGEADVPFAYPNVAKKRIDTARTTMGLQVSMGLQGGTPTFSVSGTMFKGQAGAFKQAFGLPFIDLQDYTMEFEQSADSISIGIGTGGRFYDKNIETFASVQVRASSSGIPIPKQLKFMVSPTNPNQLAHLALNDLTNAFADLTNAVTGATIPKVSLPEDFVQIKGAKAGEGPFVDVTLDISLDAGLEMAGVLNVFGLELGRVDTAVIKPTHGIEIKARTGVNLPIDVIQLPQADVDIAITKDNITDPHVRIKTETVQILGSGGSFELSIDKTRQVAVVEGASPFNLFSASLVLDSSTKNLRQPNFDATGIIEGNFFNKLADGLQAATADLVKGTEAVVSGMNKEVHDFSQQLHQARIDKSKAVNDLEAARRSATAAFNRAKAEVDKLQRDYDRENGKCGSPPWKWHHCVAAGGIWTALKAAKVVLSGAQKIVDEFLKGAGAALSAVIDGLNKTIGFLGTAIDKATGALGTALVQFTKVLDVGAKLAGKALEAVASIFDIEKLWMKGKLAILQGQQSGQLGVEYTLLGKSYLQDVSWDFKVPVDQIVEIFKPGSKPTQGGRVTAMTVAPGYTFEPSSTDTARNTVQHLLNNAVLKAVSVPFDPQMCVNNPYILDQQLAEIRAEASRLERMARNADVYRWVQAMEATPAFMAMVGNPGGSSVGWAAGRNGSVPNGAISGGSEPGRSNLYVCRGQHRGGIHPGKLVANNCNIGYGGSEIRINSYEVLVGTGASWAAGRNGSVPSGAYAGGSEPGRTLYICRARHANGTHPGKLVANNCNIGYGGKEIQVNSYEVMTAPAQVNPAHVPYRVSLAQFYKSGKASNAQPENDTRFNQQGTILQQIDANMARLSANDPVRSQTQANYKAGPKDQPVGAVDVKFLTDRRNEALALIRQLETLQKDPASPCGKAIQEARITPTAGPAPRGMPAIFGTSTYARAALDASRQLQEQQRKAAEVQAAALRRAQLVAFADRLKQREATLKAAADDAQKTQQARQAIQPLALTARPQDVQQIAAQAQASAAKMARIVQAPQAQTHRMVAAAPQPAAAAGTPQARAAVAARPVVPSVVVKPGGNIRPQARPALIEALTRDVQRHSPTGIAAAQKEEERLAALRASLIAKRQATMASRIAGLPGVTAQQQQAFAAAYAQARTDIRARMIKEVPVSRASSVPGTPFATQQANAQTVEAAADIDTAQVNANILDSMRRNLK